MISRTSLLLSLALTELRHRNNGSFLMFTMWFFSYVLFAEVDKRVPMFLWEHVEDLGKLWDYAWAQHVHRYTTSDFPQIAASIQNAVINGKVANPSISGCAFAVLATIYEHTLPALALDAPGQLPRFRKWNMSFLKPEDFKAIEDSMDPDKVPCGDLIPESAETWVFAYTPKMAEELYFGSTHTETAFSLFSSVLLKKMAASLMQMGKHVRQFHASNDNPTASSSNNAINHNSNSAEAKGVRCRSTPAARKTPQQASPVKAATGTPKPAPDASKTPLQSAPRTQLQDATPVLTVDANNTPGQDSAETVVQGEAVYDNTPVGVDPELYKVATILVSTASGKTEGGTDAQDSAENVNIGAFFMNEPSYELDGTDLNEDPLNQQPPNTLPSPFEQAESVISVVHYRDEQCVGWDANPDEANDFPHRLALSPNMRQVLQSFLNGQLRSNQNNDLEVSGTYINMVKLYNVLQGGMDSFEVVDAIAKLVCMRYRNEHNNWWYVDFQSVTTLPMANEAALLAEQPVKYRWLQDFTLANIRYLFLPHRRQTNWVLIAFDFNESEIHAWNASQTSAALEDEVSGIVSSWKAWLASKTSKPDLAEWTITWRGHIQQPNPLDSAIYIIKIMECIITGQQPTFPDDFIAATRPTLVYNILAVDFYRNMLPDITSWRNAA